MSEGNDSNEPTQIKIQSVEVSASDILESKRLDASHYSQEIIDARRLIRELEESGVQVNSVEEVANSLFRPSIHKRDYTDEANGLPYLTPTQLFIRPVTAEKFIQDPPDGLKCDPGWLLITCSGTVGRITIADSHLEDKIVSQNLIRAETEESLNGYLYAFLRSWVGQSFLTQDEYGATIKHINPDHVADIPLPRIDAEDEIHEKIIQAFEYREKADKLEKEAIDQLEETMENTAGKDA